MGSKHSFKLYCECFIRLAALQDLWLFVVKAEGALRAAVILVLLLLGRITVLYVNAAYCYRVSSVVCLSVCRSVCRETCRNGWTDPGAVWVVDSGGPNEPCIKWGSRSTCKAAILKGKGRPILTYMDRELVKNGWTDRNAVRNVDLDGPKETCVRWGAHWRHLANTTEPSMCCGGAACCQITLTTCCYRCRDNVVVVDLSTTGSISEQLSAYRLSTLLGEPNAVLRQLMCCTLHSTSKFKTTIFND